MNTPDKAGIQVVPGAPKGEAAAAKYSLRTVHDVLTPMRDGVLPAMEDVGHRYFTGRRTIARERAPHPSFPQRSFEVGLVHQ